MCVVYQNINYIKWKGVKQYRFPRSTSSPVGQKPLFFRINETLWIVSLHRYIMGSKVLCNKTVPAHNKSLRFYLLEVLSFPSNQFQKFQHLSKLTQNYRDLVERETVLEHTQGRRMSWLCFSKKSSLAKNTLLGYPNMSPTSPPLHALIGGTQPCSNWWAPVTPAPYKREGVEARGPTSIVLIALL